jgi:hypothetical protein
VKKVKAFDDDTGNLSDEISVEMSGQRYLLDI